MSKDPPRRLSREFKLKAVERLKAGESGSALARDLGIKRTLIYRWRNAFDGGGALALRDKRGRPNKADALAMAAARGPAAKAGDLAAARRQIADLERKVGAQQLDLDFFREALRHVEASRRPSDRSGVTAASPASKR